MAMSEELKNLYEILSVYKEKLSEAIDRGDERDIKHWENNIEGLEKRIAGLEI